MPRTSWDTPEVGDAPLNADRYTHDELQGMILDLLRTKPYFKWELRDALGVNEARIYKELQTLKRQGKVKVIGHCLDKRQWALR